MLPALPEELERTRLELELRRQLSSIDTLRDILHSERDEQQRVQREIDGRLSPLRNDLERLAVEIVRLESRLDRLNFSGRSISDEELDQEADDARADEAAWWAEWRHRQSERADRRIPKTIAAMPDDIHMRRVYRTLARLVHPDRARDVNDRKRREEVMRQANEAKEARDIDRLQRLLSSWSNGAELIPGSADNIRARIAELSLDRQQIRRELTQLRDSPLGRLVRLSERDLKRHLRREESKLRRELALNRLRRRRVMRTLDERRQALSASTSEASS